MTVSSTAKQKERKEADDRAARAESAARAEAEQKYLEMVGGPSRRRCCAAAAASSSSSSSTWLHHNNHVLPSGAPKNGTNNALSSDSLIM